jgi:hypothetical protein
MSKRCFVLAVAACTLLASLAFAPPTNAGSVLTTTVSFTTASPALTEIDLTYSGVGVLSNPMPTSFSGGTVTLSGTEVMLMFSPANAGPFGPLTFTLDDTTDTGASLTPSFMPTGVTLTGFSFSLKQTPNGTVPEPSTLALFGIGVTGLVVFRRLFRRGRTV